MTNNQARLILEDGTEFIGTSFGSPKSSAGEVVFATGMVGYDLSLTDPSYRGQILTFTYPLIGNWGVPPRNYWESDKIQVKGLVISDLTTAPSHWQSEKTLEQWLQEENIPGIYGIDTRALTQKLREKGVMLGKIVVGDKDIDFWDPNAANLIESVSSTEVKIHQPVNRHPGMATTTIGSRFYRSLDSLQNDKNGIKIALLNCGAKKNILRSLLARGATVYELPWNYDPFESDGWQSWQGSRQRAVNNRNQSFTSNIELTSTGGRETTDRTRQNFKVPKLDGLVISNGPGDPKMAKASIEIVKKALAKKIPTFGICLGNQLLALAAGGNTYKLKFGHRSQNQPTIMIEDPERSRRAGSKRCYITTQNHGFTVDEKKLPDGFRRWFYNANDNTNEGIIHEKLPFFSVQFHPEAAPGPTDTQWLFDYFLKSLK